MLDLTLLVVSCGMAIYSLWNRSYYSLIWVAIIAFLLFQEAKETNAAFAEWYCKAGYVYPHENPEPACIKYYYPQWVAEKVYY